MESIGYVGLGAFARAWIPQSVDAIRAVRCDINLLLAFIGNALLMTYAAIRSDALFVIVNAFTTAGALVNLYYKLFPRPSS
jgi:lipid-A-disaccharide synthase-like uncharacterized protein